MASIIPDLTRDLNKMTAGIAVHNRDNSTQLLTQAIDTLSKLNDKSNNYRKNSDYFNQTDSLVTAIKKLTISIKNEHGSSERIYTIQDLLKTVEKKYNRQKARFIKTGTVKTKGKTIRINN